MNEETKPEFDLSQYELEDTATLTVQNAAGTDDLIGADGVNPVRIAIYGSGTKQAVRALHKAGMAAQLRVQAMMRGKVEKNAAEKSDEEQKEKLVMITKSIENFPITAEKLYANPKLGYITSQVLKFFEDDANFAKPSAKS